MNTYELTEAAARLLHQLEDTGGELTEEAAATLDAFIEGSEDKLAAIAAVRGRLATEAAHHKAMALRHTERRKASERAAERVNGLALRLLQSRAELGEPSKVRGDWGLVSLTRRKSLEVVEEEIPATYWKEKVTRAVDKTALKAALKAGPVEGAHLVEVEGVTWRR